jgi:hypothetical protein
MAQPREFAESTPAIFHEVGKPLWKNEDKSKEDQRQYPHSSLDIGIPYDTLPDFPPQSNLVKDTFSAAEERKESPYSCNQAKAAENPIPFLF